MTAPFERPHLPLIAQDTDEKSWFSYCQACSAKAGQYVIECREPTGQPWPPFLLVEAPWDQRPLTPEYVAELSARHDPTFDPRQLQVAIIETIEAKIRSHPRHSQKEIGPSEIGHNCGRWIAYKVSGAEQMNPAANQPSWRSQVGVIVHAWLAELFDMPGKALTERNVHVGSGIRGTSDFYDPITGSVVDWKIVSKGTLDKARTKVRVCKRCAESPCEHIGLPRGPVDNLDQAQTYGAGFDALGLPVKWVIIALIPASGDLSEAFFHIEPYNPDISAARLSRVNGTKAMLASLPFDTVLNVMPTADGGYWGCSGCEYFDPEAKALSSGCPGHPGRNERKDSLYKLLPPDDDGEPR